MKRLIALFLALLMVFSLVACGQKEEAPAIEETEETMTKAPATEAPEEKDNESEDGTSDSKVITENKATLKVSLEAIDADRQNLYEIFTSTYKEYFPNFEVEFDQPATESSEYMNRLHIYCAGGDMPDVFWCGDEIAIETGNAMPLSEKLKADGWTDNLKTDASLIPYSDGEIYTVQAGNDAYYLRMAWYNKAIFEEVGVEVPTTYSEFLDVCEKIKAAGYIPVSVSGDPGDLDNVWLSEMIASNSPDTLSKLIAKEISWTDPSVVAGIEKLEEMINLGYFEEDLATCGWTQASNLFNEGLSAMWFEPAWGLSCITLDMDQVDFFMIPSEDGSKSTAAWGSFASGYSVSTKSEYPEEALMFAEWMATQDAIYFEGIGVPCAVNTGVEMGEMSPLQAKCIDIVNGKEYKKVSNVYPLYPADVKAQLTQQMQMLVTKQINAQQFAEAMAAIWN